MKIFKNFENDETNKYMIKNYNLKNVNKKKLAYLILVPVIICGSIIGTATTVKASQIEDNYYNKKETSSIMYVDENTNKLAYQTDKSHKENNNLRFIDSEENSELLDYIALGVSCTALGLSVANFANILSKRKR